PQAEDVGMLTEDERTGELRVQVQRHRERSTGAQPPLTRAPTAPATATDKKKTFGGELRVPGTIIQHVVSDKRGVLLGETNDESNEAVGTRMGAPLLYHGSQYGVVYVESTTQSFRQDDVDLLQAIATQAGLAMHATRTAAQL